LLYNSSQLQTPQTGFSHILLVGKSHTHPPAAGYPLGMQRHYVPPWQREIHTLRHRMTKNAEYLFGDDFQPKDPLLM
jgi:hypothetical protein